MLLVRDAVVVLASVVIIGSQYQKLGEEPVFYLTVTISAVLLVLSAVDIALVALKTKRRGYFLANSAFQLVPGFLYVGLILPLGVLMVGLNLAALVTLRQKKTPEELLKHRPILITRNYRVVVGIGTLVMLASLFLPWFSDSGSSVSLFGVYSALATKTALPGFSIPPTAVVFALVGLAGSPVALGCGVLGLVRRRFALVAGGLGAVAGAGLAVALGGASGVGEYAFAAGGVVVLAGFFGFRRTA